MSKPRSLSARRWSKWPVALVLGLAAVTPVVTALVAGCGSSGSSGDSQGQTRQVTWAASQSTTDAIGVSTWRATFDANAPTKVLFEGLASDAKTVKWTSTYRSPDDSAATNGQAAFLTPAGEMDFGSAGVSINTLNAASRYGLAALSYDLDAAGVDLPISTPGSSTPQTHTLNEGLVGGGDGSIVATDGAAIVKDGGTLVDGGDASLVEAGKDPLVCAMNALINSVAKTLGSFISTCSGSSISLTFGSSGVSTKLNNTCGNIGQTFVNNLASGLSSCTSNDSGAAAKSGDSGSSSSSATGIDSGLVSNTGTKLVGSPASDAGGGSTGSSSSSGDDDDDDDSGTTATPDSGTTPTPDSGTTTTPDSGTTTTTPDSGTTTTTTPDSGTTTTTTTDAGTDAGAVTTTPVTNVPYAATGYVLVDDAINTDTQGVTCTATLISSYVAVTTASCLYVKNAQGTFDPPWARHRFAFGQGVVNDATRNATREAVQVVANPDYEPVDGGPVDPTKDVGLIFLLPATNGSQLSIATVSTAPLASGTRASGVGYGLTSATQVVNGVPNANFRKTFPFTIGAPNGELFPATVSPTLTLCGGDQGSGAYDTASGNLLGILTSASITASCTPGAGGNYLTLSSFSPFQTCTVTRVADQTATYTGPTDCR